MILMEGRNENNDDLRNDKIGLPQVIIIYVDRFTMLYATHLWKQKRIIYYTL